MGLALKGLRVEGEPPEEGEAGSQRIRDLWQEAVSAAQVDRDVALVRKTGLAGLVALLQGLEVVAVATAPTKEEYFTAAGILRLGKN